LKKEIAPMAKNKLRRLVCGDPRAVCFNLESAIRDLWCSLLVETLAAERDGIRRAKTAIFLRRGTANIVGAYLPNRERLDLKG
jgi:hypothetical protein